MYLVIKHSHLLLVSITLILFNLRYWWRVLCPQRSLPKILKILPHLNDTILLLTGFGMMYLARWNPTTNATWLGVKLLLVVVYILAGARALKSPLNSTMAWFGYVLAMVCVASIIYLAHWKPF